MGKRIVWDELLPSDDSQTDPREVQNIWKAITDALQVSFEFPTSGLAKGGAAKFHTAAAGTTGWTAEHAAQYTSNKTNLHVWDAESGRGSTSSISYLVGSQRFIEHADAGEAGSFVQVSGQSFYNTGVAAASQQLSYASDGQLAAPLARVYYGGAEETVEPFGGISYPFVQLSSINTNYLMTMSYISAGGFRAFHKSVETTGTPDSTFTLNFLSSGTTVGAL